jgi:hypothetical protein
MRKDIVKIPESLRFDGVAAGIAEKHRALLAWLAFEPDNGRYVEGHVIVFESFCERKPGIEREDDAEMRHHHLMLADNPGARDLEWFADVQGDLVSEKIEIDPGFCAAPFQASQNASIESAGLLQVMDMIGHVKDRLHRGKLSFLAYTAFSLPWLQGMYVG